MTRDEAVKLVHRVYTSRQARSSAEMLVDNLVTLGLLAIDKQDDFQAHVHARLQGIMVELVSASGWSADALTGGTHTGHLTSYGAGCILSGLDQAGLAIVRKESAK